MPLKFHKKSLNHQKVILFINEWVTWLEKITLIMSLNYISFKDSISSNW